MLSFQPVQEIGKQLFQLIVQLKQWYKLTYFLFTVGYKYFFFKKANKQKPCLLVFRSGLGKAVCVLNGGSSHQHLPTLFGQNTGLHDFTLGFTERKKKKKELLQMERYLQMLAILCAHLYSVDFVADPWGF